MDHPFAVTLDLRSSLANHTGTWRTERPVYVDLVPPCSTGCPAGEDVRGWLYHAEDGSYEAAWRTLVATNPFPAIMGRVCYHPCETACNRAQLDEAVGINSVERFLGDEAVRQGWTLPPPAASTGRRVLVVGAGPAGLAAAYHLRRLGHDVEIHEARSQAGGMMRSGIPTFRLPRDVLDIELARLLDTGVTLRLDTPVTDLDPAMRDGGFDAVFMAVGARLAHRAYVPAGQAAKVLDALEVLDAAAAGERPRLGRRVVVYGGGNTAMDVARTARRLGAEDAVVVYRRTRDRMPAQDVEVEQAEQEGVRMRWLSTIADVGDGTVRLERMELDDAGVPQPTGEFEDLPGDAVVLALGQDVDHTLVDTDHDIHVDHGLIEVGTDLMTGRPGVFAGGDAVGTQRSVAVAVGHGRRAATRIDAWLAGRPAPVEPAPTPIGFDALNPWYYADAPAALRPELAAARRTADFEEVVGGLDADRALFEARRCLSCGSCFGCDNCFGVCPDNAVHKVIGMTGPGAYVIDTDFCKGCGLCAQECPCGAIEMRPEPT